MRLRFPQRDEIYGLTDGPAIAVDLGFAEKSKSCGLAWRTSEGSLGLDRFGFGQCIDKTAAFISSNANPVLVVEAPLSGLLNGHGNPVGRKLFERTPMDGKTVSRYWYVGAGAAVGLGAVFFFSRLASLLGSDANVVDVIEGFVSFKTRSSEHEKDALALLDGLTPSGFSQALQRRSRRGEQRVNMLSFAGLASESDPCPVVMVVTVR